MNAAGRHARGEHAVQRERFTQFPCNAASPVVAGNVVKKYAEKINKNERRRPIGSREPCATVTGKIGPTSWGITHGTETCAHVSNCPYKRVPIVRYTVLTVCTPRVFRVRGEVKIAKENHQRAARGARTFHWVLDFSRQRKGKSRTYRNNNTAAPPPRQRLPFAFDTVCFTSAKQHTVWRRLRRKLVVDEITLHIVTLTNQYQFKVKPVADPKGGGS